MKTYLLKAGERQAIAKAGETDVAVAYNAKTWMDEYPAGNPQLMVTTPGGKRVPVTVEAVDNLITGQVPNELLAGPGVYSYVFVWTSGSTQMESGRCECLVLGSNLAKDMAHDQRGTPDWAERIFLAAEVIEGAIPGMMEARNTTADNAAEAKTAAEAAAESESAAADSAEAAAASEENIDTILTNMEQTITDATAAMNGIEAQKNTMIASIASVAGQGTDTTLTQSGVAADAKAAGDQISDLRGAYNESEDLLFGNYVMNPNNVFTGWKLDSSVVTPISEATIVNSEPTNILALANTTTAGGKDVCSIDIGDAIASGTQGDKYYIHCTVKANRNAQFASKPALLHFDACVDSSVKGTFYITLTSPSADNSENKYVDYVYEYTRPAQAINKFNLWFAIGFDIYVKNFYITKGTDSAPLFKTVSMSDSQNSNGLKLAIIGDSLSAYDATVDNKYHQLLETNNGYNVTNVAVAGSSYMCGSLKGGYRNHYFYNQATRIPNDTEAVLAFGSFNDLAMIHGRWQIYNSSNELVAEGAAAEAPSSSATLLETDSSDSHTATHNAELEIATGLYRFDYNNTRYQFNMTTACPSGGKVVLLVCTLGEIGTDDSDNYSLVGAFKTMLDNLYAVNNGMVIGIVAPTPWSIYNNVDPLNHWMLEDCTNYVAKLKELANHYGLPYLDLYNQSNLKPWNDDFLDTYYNNADGVHPNNLGHATFIYPHMREFLRTYNFKNID